MEPKSETSKAKENKLNAQKYLDEYDLEVVVSEMLNSLVHEKHKQPYVYMIKYLAGLMTEEERETYHIPIPGPYPVGRPAVRFPKFDSSSSSLLKTYLTKEKWNELRLIKTKHGNNINSLTKLSTNKPSDPIGSVIVDGDCFNVYSSLLNDIIASIHSIPSDLSSLKEYRITQFDLIRPNELPLDSGEIINRAEKVVLSFSRNVSDYPFNHFSSGTNKLAAVEALLIKTILSLQADSVIPECSQLDMKTNKSEVYSLLNYIGFDMEWFNASGLNQSWPECRTVFATKDKSVIILINFADHLQLCICNEKGTIDVPQMYNKAIELLKQIALMVSYEASPQFGYLTSHISLLGAGLKIGSVIALEELSKEKLNEDTTLNDLVHGLGFDVYSYESINGHLYSSQSCKLSYDNDKDFIINYIAKLCGLIQLNDKQELRGELSFKQLALGKDKGDDAGLKDIYEKSFDGMKYLLSVQGNNLNSLLKSYEKGEGMIVQDLCDYNVFFPFIQQYLLSSQQFNPATTEHIHKPDEPKQMIEIAPEDLEKINNVTISLMRNIEGKELSHCKSNSNHLVEETIRKAIDSINHKGHFATYFPYDGPSSNANSDLVQLLQESNLMTTSDDQPSHRGIIQFAKENLYAVVNERDHIRFILYVKQFKEKCGSSLVSLLKTVNEFSKHIVFSYNIKLGFLTTNPRYLGTGLDIRLQIRLKNLSKEALEDFLKEKNDKQFECTVVAKSNEENGYQVEVWNKITIGVSETELLTNLLSYLNDILLRDMEYSI